MNNTLAFLGFEEWAEKQHLPLYCEPNCIARIIEVNKNRFVVRNESSEMIAELSGRFLYESANSSDFPTVGDWVEVNALDDNSHGIINNLLPRSTFLARKEAGKRTASQLIAANIDIGLIVQSATHLNMNLLDRYLVMLAEGGISPLVVLTKKDLLSDEQLDALYDTMCRIDVEYVLLSNVLPDGVTALSRRLLPCKTYCLLGQSGVGKTSLLNSLIGESKYKVNSVRDGDGKGRHTTTRRQLIVLSSGSIFVDTPGMRELGNTLVEHGIEMTFDWISTIARNCKYNDCTHIHEEGCAVLGALEKGELDEKRYNNFLKIAKESKHYEMSSHERRDKEKKLCKHQKNYKKTTRKGKW